MKTVYLIRHGQTPGNRLGRYIGTTDERLTQEGKGVLCKILYPSVDIVYSSPMKRCVESAQILYPLVPKVTIDDFRECDFGLFENKNYKELAEEPLYQQWVDSNGTMDFPNGESVKGFKNRVLQAFAQILRSDRHNTAAMVVHGGVIMTILEQYGIPKRGYYDWQVKNGCGFAAEIKSEQDKHKLFVVQTFKESR